MGAQANHRSAWATWLRPLDSRNSLVRKSDRVEAAVVRLCVILALLALPVAGLIWSTTHADLIDRVDRESAASRPVPAVLLDDAPPARPGAAPVTGRVEWTVNGTHRTGTAQVPPGSRAGVTVTVWVDSRGERVPKPLTQGEAAFNATLFAVWVWLSFVGLLAGIACLVRWILNRQRYAAWDEEWRQASRTWGAG